MSVNYRVILGFDVIAVSVLEAEESVSNLIKAANSISDLKEDLVGLRVVELPNGMAKD